MAGVVGIGSHWFHKTHYDIPQGLMDTISHTATLIRAREVLAIIKEKKQTL